MSLSRLRQLRELKTAIDNEISELEAKEKAERDRLAAIRRRVQAAQHAASICGTDSGYYHHRNTSKTPTCGPCKSAHAEAERIRLARRRLAS